MRVIQFNDITIYPSKISWKHCWISRSNTNLSKKESHTPLKAHTLIGIRLVCYTYIYVNIGRKSIETVGVAEHTRKPAARLLEQNRNEIPASIRVLKASPVLARTKTAARDRFQVVEPVRSTPEILPWSIGPLNRIFLLANPLEWSSYREIDDLAFGFKMNRIESYIAYFFSLCIRFVKVRRNYFFFFISVCLEYALSL